MDSRIEENPETCTVYAVYTYPHVAGLSGENHELAIDYIGRGIPEVVFMLDGTEQVDGECAACCRLAYKGACPGPRAHAFAQWRVESTRNIWYPTEMGEFDVPVHLNYAGRAQTVKRIILQRERETMRTDAQK